MIFKKRKNAAEIFESLPQELKVAYFNDTLVHGIIRRSQYDSCDLQETMTRLAIDLYKSHKAFRERELKRTEKEMDLIGYREGQVIWFGNLKLGEME